MKIAFITGITGQDGSYLAELLLSKDYEVYGLIRRASVLNTLRIDHLLKEVNDESGNATNPRLHLVFGDVATSESIVNIVYNIQPNEIYHLAAQSHVRVSFDMPGYTGDVTGLGTVRILEAIRKSGIQTRFYQASSSEMFGSAKPPQHENTAFQPQSPYAIAKLYSYWIARNYREGYKMFASNGILFNHESPRRGEAFVTRKVTRGLASILAGKQKFLYLSNLDAKRDWGYAPDYVRAMWMILQHDQADDFVIGTGESHSIREFLDAAIGYLNLDWHDYVRIDQHLFRPTEVDYLMADATKARKALGWEPLLTFQELVKVMVDADLELAGLQSPGEGSKILAARHDRWHKWENQVSTMEIDQGQAETGNENGINYWGGRARWLISGGIAAE